MTIYRLSDRTSTGIPRTHYSASDAGIRKLPDIILTYVSAGDTNDLFYYLGQLATGTWQNPYTSGQISIIVASPADGPEAAYADPTQLVSQACASFFYTGNVAGSAVIFDIGINRKITINKYVIQHDFEATGNFLRNWKLQISNDVAANTVAGVSTATWTDIDTQVNNTTINGRCVYGTFTPAGTPPSGRWVKLIQTGFNSLNNNYLEFGELELYGAMETG